MDLGRFFSNLLNQNLQRKADTSFEILKCGIGPKWIKSGPEQDAWVKTLFIASFERRHRIIGPSKVGSLTRTRVVTD